MARKIIQLFEQISKNKTMFHTLNLVNKSKLLGNISYLQIVHFEFNSVM